jgi:hypothetical protein
MLSSFFLAIGLSAASGLRVFLPLFALSLAARLEYVTLSKGSEWIGSVPALLLATPAAMVVGVLLCAAVIIDGSPVVGLGVPLIVGAGIAGISQSLVSFLPMSPAIAAGSAALVALASLLFPVPAGALVLAYFVIRWKQVRQAVAR